MFIVNNIYLVYHCGSLMCNSETDKALEWEDDSKVFYCVFKVKRQFYQYFKNKLLIEFRLCTDNVHFIFSVFFAHLFIQNNNPSS